MTAQMNPQMKKTTNGTGLLDLWLLTWLNIPHLTALNELCNIHPYLFTKSSVVVSSFRKNYGSQKFFTVS